MQIRDLKQSTTRLTHWTGPDSSAIEATTRSLPGEHVCAATPSADLVPYESNLHGHTHLERRYHRAAVVVWPRELAFANRAEADPAWALEGITRKAAAGDVESARAMAGSLSAFWEEGPFQGSEWRVVRGEGWPGGLLGRTLGAAGAVADAEIAAMLLRPFSITDLTDADAPLLETPAGCYGPEWTAGVLRRWFGERRGWGRSFGKQERQEWTTERLPGLCAALHMAGDAGAGVARQLLDLTWARLAEDVGTSIAWSQKNRTAFHRLGDSLAAILLAAAAAGVPDTRDAVTRHLREQPDPVAALEVYTVRAAAAATGGGASRQDGFRDLAADCAARLRSWLAPDPAEQSRGTRRADGADARTGGPGAQAAQTARSAAGPAPAGPASAGPAPSGGVRSGPARPGTASAGGAPSGSDRQGRTGRVIAEPARTR